MLSQFGLCSNMGSALFSSLKLNYFIYVNNFINKFFIDLYKSKKYFYLCEYNIQKLWCDHLLGHKDQFIFKVFSGYFSLFKKNTYVV